MKLYQLTVLRSKKEEEEEEEDVITIPSVDNMELIRCEITQSRITSIRGCAFRSLLCSLSVGQSDEGMSGIAIFFTVLFSMLGCIFLIVIGLVVYSHWNENRRKRFY